MALLTIGIWKRKKVPDKEEAAQEALHAYELLQHAEGAETISLAVPALNQFLQVVKCSSQKEIYDTDGVQEVLAGHIVQHVQKHSPQNMMITPPLAAPSLEEAISAAIFEVREMANGVMDESVIVEYALENVYQHQLQQLAQIMIKNRENQNLDVPRLVQDYEKVKAKYQRLAGPENIPTIYFEQDGRWLEQTTEHIVYQRAFYFYCKALENYSTQPPLQLIGEAAQQQFQTINSCLDKYLEQGEFSETQKKRLENTRKAFQEHIEQKKQEGHAMALLIEEKHDCLYDRFAAAASLFAAEILFEHLMNLSIAYASLFDINLDSLVGEGKKKFASLGAELAFDGQDQLIVISPEEIYHISIKRTKPETN